MFRIFAALTLIFLSIFKLSAQDVLVDKKGNELPCQLIGVDKKYFSYKGFEDPEFTTRKSQISKYKKIRYADGREVKISPPATGWVFVGGGPVFPLFSYASSKQDDQYAGFAKTDGGFQGEVAIPAFGKRKRWSILGMTGGYTNGMGDNGKLAWYQGANHQNSVGQYSNSQKEDKWRVATVLMGVAYTLPITWKFSIDQKLALGAGFIKKPNEHYGYTVYNGAGSPTYYQYYSYGEVKGTDTLRAQTTALTFSYGAAVRFFVSRTVALRLGADFQYSAPTFKVHQYLYSIPATTYPFDPGKAESIHQKISVLRVSVGVCINLTPKNIDYGISK